MILAGYADVQLSFPEYAYTLFWYHVANRNAVAADFENAPLNNGHFYTYSDLFEQRPEYALELSAQRAGITPEGQCYIDYVHERLCLVVTA